MSEPMALEAVLDLVQAEILKHPPDEIFAAAVAAPIALADRYNRKRIRDSVISFTQRYGSAREILRAFEKKALDIRECAIDILAGLDARSAIDLASMLVVATVEPRTFAYEYERAWAFETLARDRASLTLNRLVDKMPIDEVLERVARRQISEVLAGAALAAHPSLQSGPGLLSALERTPAVIATLAGTEVGPGRDFAEWIASKLAAVGYAEAAPLLLRLHGASTGPLAQSAAIARAAVALGAPRAAPAPIPVAPSLAPPPPVSAQGPRARPPAGDWLARYRAGQYGPVWAEVCATDMGDPDLRAEARGVAAEMMGRVRHNLVMIADRLKEGGYRFRGRALDAPAADVGATIARTEKLAGCALPLALQVFYEVVGAVDLEPSEQVDDDTDEGFAMPPFPGFGECDPLVVYPAEQALFDIEQWERSPSGPPRVAISVEAGCKAVPANGSDAPYRVTLGGYVADATVEGVAGAPTFVAYLRSSLRWGGFAGLATILDPLVPKSKAIAKKKRRTVDEWRLVFAERLLPDLLPF